MASLTKPAAGMRRPASGNRVWNRRTDASLPDSEYHYRLETAVSGGKRTGA